MALLKKKMNHRVTESNFKNHLDVMRANYLENIITSKVLPKPLWLRLNKNDKLNIIYRDKDIIFQKGRIYYAYLVQANDKLFEKGNVSGYPADVLYSTHPIAEKYPEFLENLGSEMYYYKGKSEEEIPESLRNVVRIITDEHNRSSIDFNLRMPNPENPDEMIENIDVHFRTVMIFRKDIPNRVLQGSFLPVLVAPSFSSVLILPKEYWTAPFYDTDLIADNINFEL